MGAKVIILLFLYVYPLFFMSIPLSSRIIFGILGFFSFILHNKHNSKEWTPLRALIPLMLWSVVVGTIHQTYDFAFLNYGVSIVLIYFAGLFLVRGMKVITFSTQVIDYVLTAFVIVVLIQSLFAISFYFFPSFQSFCYKIFPLTDREFYSVELSQGTRFIGLGSCFFGAGAIHGLALLVLAYLFFTCIFKSKVVWTFSYMVILFTGVMMARTTIIGLVFSILLIFAWKPFNIKILRHKFALIILFIVAILLFIGLVLTYLDEQILMQAFEFFYNYEKSGSFESASTNRLGEMYAMPKHFDTFLFGDGLYNLKSGGYYMSTDVGYMRLLYYGGIPMIIFYYYFQWYMVKCIISLGVPQLFRLFLYLSFFYLLVLNLKGFMDFAPYYLLLYTLLYCHSHSNKKINHFNKCIISYETAVLEP